MLTLTTGRAAATIDPYGAQVLSYTPAGMADVLWTTSDEHLAAARKAGKAPRGGVPVCWPWFGPHPTDKAGPVHGLGRIATWTVERTGPTRAALIFATDGTNALFPHKAEARLEVMLGSALDIALTTRNVGATSFRLTEGLHTYLRIGDVAEVEIEGLEAAASNKDDGGQRPVRIAGEVDRIYRPVTGSLRVVDRQIGRVITVTNTGCTEAVVWNPGSDKPDMPTGSYRQMLCVEPANAADAPELAPGASHTIATRLSVARSG